MHVYICIKTYTYAYTYICINMIYRRDLPAFCHINICIYIYLFIYVYIYTFTFICEYVYMCNKQQVQPTCSRNPWHGPFEIWSTHA